MGQALSSVRGTITIAVTAWVIFRRENGSISPVCILDTLTDTVPPSRQCNMDYILLSTLVLTAAQLLAIFISYDITCSFSVNFFRRLLKFPEHLQFDFEDILVSWAVPKFHLLAHGKKCQGRYSLNFQRGSARTHGEGVESNWYLTNQFALSTREMTAAGRHEVLNDAAGHINWSKTTKIRKPTPTPFRVSTNTDILAGETLYKDIQIAVRELEKQRVLFGEFHASVPTKFTDEWERLVIAYEEDPTGVNPYAETVTGVFHSLFNLNGAMGG